MAESPEHGGVDEFHEDNALLFSRESLNLRRESVSEEVTKTYKKEKMNKTDVNVNEVKEVRSAIVKGRQGWHTHKEGWGVRALQKGLLCKG